MCITHTPHLLICPTYTHINIKHTYTYRPHIHTYTYTTCIYIPHTHTHTCMFRHATQLDATHLGLSTHIHACIPPIITHIISHTHLTHTHGHTHTHTHSFPDLEHEVNQFKKAMFTKISFSRLFSASLSTDKHCPES